MIIDVHGHYTTAPKALEAWRNQQIAGITDPSARPRVVGPDDQRRRDPRDDREQPAQADAASVDRTSRSSARARASWPTTSATSRSRRRGPRSATSSAHASASLFPDHFIPAAMLPQSPGVAPRPASPSCDKCVEQYGAVAINLNPDPSGGHWTSPPLTDRHWYPIYEKHGRIRHPGDDPREHELQRVLPHHRRALHQRRHDGVHAADSGRPVQGLPDPALRHPARRRRRALPLGPLPGPRAGAEEAAAPGPPAEQRLLRHLRLPPAGDRPADPGRAGRRTSCSPAR